MPLKKPVATMYCTADFRTDRCPAQIKNNGCRTVQAACGLCPYVRFELHRRGKIVAEIGDKEVEA